MGTPKKRQSASRGKKRRTHWKFKVPTLVKCPNCGTLILPHTKCPNCDHYAGKEIKL